MSNLKIPVKPMNSLMPTAEQRTRLRKIRRFKDQFSRYGITAAGIAVVFSLGLIFFYLFSEVAPLFRGASIEIKKNVPATHYGQQESIAYMTLERYEELGTFIDAKGNIRFWDVNRQQARAQVSMAIPEAAQLVSVGKSIPSSGLVALGYSNGQVLVLKPSYALSYPNDQREITPGIAYPLESSPLLVDEQGAVLRLVALQEIHGGILLGAVTADERILLASFSSSQNFLTGETRVMQDVYSLPPLPSGERALFMQIDESGRHLVVASDQSKLYLFNILNPAAAEQRAGVKVSDAAITAMEFLVGTGSLVIGTAKGEISQWFLVRDTDNQYHVQHVRDFDALSGAITVVSPEYSRRGFWVGDDRGNLGAFYATSERTLLIEKLSDKAIRHIAISPINSRALIVDDSQSLMIAEVWNRHPEVSFSSLWQKVWYEGREAPDYIWQASSGSDSFEAKMSFVPLSLGTIKAAFFAMLFAIPLGVMGAIYTAYFMTPRLRGLVKPTIEIMEALPTVILGFLAGLWLAPFIENHLPAIFAILVAVPLVMLLVGYLWSRLPGMIRERVPAGWEAVILMLPIVLTGWACVAISAHTEVWLFDGSMRQWFTNNGINYDQRNALVVGIVMGFAVIPTIFSIAEDAVFSVPRHLTQGSLALGATRWQTVVGVVLPTASPGIFSAVMMGFGRAVGETMIVLMATGNSPVVNFNIFEGMRTLSANIAVELPETAVASTHFRVLFLAALVLLAFTFVVNTLAEIVRQRLRQRYSNL